MNNADVRAQHGKLFDMCIYRMSNKFGLKLNPLVFTDYPYDLSDSESSELALGHDENPFRGFYENNPNVDDDNFDESLFLLANPDKLRENQTKTTAIPKKEIVIVREFSFRQMREKPILLVIGRNSEEKSKVVQGVMALGNTEKCVRFDGKIDCKALRSILDGTDKKKYSIVFDDCFESFDEYDSKTKCATYELFISQRETKIQIVISASNIVKYPEFVRQMLDYVVLLNDDNCDVRELLGMKYGKKYDGFMELYDGIFRGTSMTSAMVLAQKRLEISYFVAEDVSDVSEDMIVDAKDDNFDIIEEQPNATVSSSDSINNADPFVTTDDDSYEKIVGLRPSAARESACG